MAAKKVFKIRFLLAYFLVIIRQVFPINWNAFFKKSAAYSQRDKYHFMDHSRTSKKLLLNMYNYRTIQNAEINESLLPGILEDIKKYKYYVNFEMRGTKIKQIKSAVAYCFKILFWNSLYYSFCIDISVRTLFFIMDVLIFFSF